MTRTARAFLARNGKREGGAEKHVQVGWGGLGSDLLCLCGWKSTHQPWPGESASQEALAEFQAHVAESEQ